MAATIGKPVKVIKRCDRNRVLILPPYSELRTAAQEQREMVSMVMSWIRDRKRAKTISSNLFHFGSKEERLEPEQGSLS